MGAASKGSGEKTNSMVLECANGLMVEDMKGIGKITSCMGKVPIPGLTADAMKENTSKTRKKEKVSLCGLMELNTMGCGRKACFMVKVTTLTKKG